MKKIFTIVMSVMMIACFMPTMAFAEQPATGSNSSTAATYPADFTESNWTGNNTVYYNGTQYQTLVDALTAVYKSSPTDTAVLYCKAGADVGTMTHGHVADSITIYGNGAYISGGECDLEVDMFGFNRDTGKEDKQNGAYLEKDITIKAYQLDNLGVWGARHTNYTVNIELVDCDSRNLADDKSKLASCQRIMILGTSGINNLTLKDCDFISYDACTLKIDASGCVRLDGCTFTEAAEPINLKHDAETKATFIVKDCKFINCGSTGNDDKDYAAPIRFVNGTEGNGSVEATVENCSFSGTIGTNGDILIGDGRNGKTNDYEITLSVVNAGSDTTVMAQKSGYYNSDKTTTNSDKACAVTVAKGENLSTSWSKMFSAKAVEIGDKTYPSLAEAVSKATAGDTITLLKNVAVTSTVELDKNCTLDLDGKTITGKNCRALLVKSGKLELTGSGTITSTGIAIDSSVIRVGTGDVDTKTNGTAAELVVGKDVVIDAPASYGITAFGGDTTEVVTIYGTVNATGYNGDKPYDGCAVSTLGTDTETPATVNIEDGAKIIAAKTNAIYVPSGTLHVKGGTITGTTGIYFKSTNMTVSGGTITGNGAAADYKYYGNGGYSTGEAVTIDSCNYPGEIGEVKLTGGYFKSENAKAVGSYNSKEGPLQTKFISGGLFNTKPDASYCVDDLTVVASGNSKYPFTVKTIEKEKEVKVVDTAKTEAKTAENVNIKVEKEEGTATEAEKKLQLMQ